MPVGNADQQCGAPVPHLLLDIFDGQRKMNIDAGWAHITER